ncbi:MAG: DUF4302 domain-containing protein [Chitinophagaceae bacterium]|nr:DUF4302 domain-containing protein [Chitinophagaceae bacterium]
MRKFWIHTQNIIGTIFLVSLAITSCKKENDHLFDQSPDERISQKLEEYQQVLASAPDGWKAVYTPAAGGTYNFYFRFNAENRVFMYSDFDTATANNEKESSYRLKALQQPALIFDTYSYIHLLSDPRGSVNGGQNGQGLRADFEFAINSVAGDSMVLTGRVNGTKLTLYKASSQDYAAWQNGDWGDALSFLNVSKILEYFKRLVVGGTQYEVDVDPVSKTIIFRWLSGSNLQQVTTGFSFNAGMLVLDEPVVNGAQTITGFTDISWDPNTMTMHLKVNNTPGTIAGNSGPLKTDTNAPQRWWQESAIAGYWQSLWGFHVNGEDDAYGFLQMPGAPEMVFISQYGNSGGIVYDLLGFFGETVGFGAGYSPPTFTADGRVIFSILGVLGTVPDGANPAFSNTALTLADENGFYLVQKSEKIYDMVSAADSKVWITWGRP